ncbi:MAG: hypothetical protein ACM3ZV_13490 [Bacillota bacterium]
MLLASAAYAAALVGGFATKAMVMPPVFSFDRHERPVAFWAAALFNFSVAVLGLWESLG